MRKPPRHFDENSANSQLEASHFAMEIGNLQLQMLPRASVWQCRWDRLDVHATVDPDDLSGDVGRAV
jgi:hypothetical protein